MSQRCRGQANNDDIVQRVRSIILMHRPHLATRIDLQLPELVMEALMPNSSNANQITHNFNYKYDYNTNMPNAFNPFMQQQLQQPPPPTTQQPGAAPPLQSFTFNTAPPPQSATDNAAGTPANVATPAPDTRVITAPLSIEPNDLNNLNVLYVNAQQAPSVASYKQLLRQIVFIVRKYIRYEQITISLELLETFDSFQTNDLNELLQCIERETKWSISRGSNVCRLISILVSAYCRVVTQVTQRVFYISTIKTEERLLTHVSEVEQVISDMLLARSKQALTPDSQLIKKEQLDSLTENLQERNDQLVRAQTTITNLQQKLDAADSKNMIISNAFMRMQTFFMSNVEGMADLKVDDTEGFVTRIIDYYTRLHSQQSQTVSTLTEHTDAYAELQQRYFQNESTLASMQLKLDSFEDTQSKLRAAQERNQQLQQQLTLQTEKHNKLLTEFSALKKETRKPMRKIKVGKGEASRMKNRKISRLVENQQALVSERRQINNAMTELKQQYAANLEDAEKTVRQLRMDLQEARSRVETLASNQAALTPTDLKLLNTKSSQVLADRVSMLKAENDAVKEMCNRELARESAELKDRLDDSKNSLNSRIDKLISQLEPLQSRIEQSTADIQQFEVNYERLARNASQTQSGLPQ